MYFSAKWQLFPLVLILSQFAEAIFWVRKLILSSVYDELELTSHMSCSFQIFKNISGMAGIKRQSWLAKHNQFRNTISVF